MSADLYQGYYNNQPNNFYPTYPQYYGGNNQPQNYQAMVPPNTQTAPSYQMVPNYHQDSNNAQMTPKYFDYGYPVNKEPENRVMIAKMAKQNRNLTPRTITNDFQLVDTPRCFCKKKNGLQDNCINRDCQMVNATKRFERNKRYVEAMKSSMKNGDGVVDNMAKTLNNWNQNNFGMDNANCHFLTL